MAKNTLKAKMKPVAQKPIQQMFKIDAETYRKVRVLAAARTGTGKAATGQDIFVEALGQYLERNSREFELVASLAGQDE